MKKRVKKLLQNLLLLFVTLIFIVGVLEVGVRLAKTEINPPSMFESPQEGVPYKLRANFHGSTPTGIPLDINSVGVRDDEYELEPPEGVFRIVILGDSVTFGQAVSKEDTYTEQLEALYAEEGKNVEIINAGVSGYGTHEQMLFLEETAINYNPNLIIVGYALNDLGAIPPAFRDGSLKSKILFKTKEVVKYNLWSYSYITRTVQSLQYNIRTENTSLSYSDFTIESSAWNVTYDAMKGIKEISDQNHAELVIAILPELRFINMTTENYKFADVHDNVFGQFREIGDVEVLDLLPAFEGQVRPEITVSMTDAHPNRDGHEIIAKSIKEFLDEREIVN
jgi:lysophospholipase L1-like esterase